MHLLAKYPKFKYKEADQLNAMTVFKETYLEIGQAVHIGCKIDPEDLHM